MDRRMMMQQSAAAELVTDGLLHYWDAVDNSGNGHDDTITSWKDLIGSADLIMNDPTKVTWNSKGLTFTGVTAQRLEALTGTTTPAGKTLEIFFSPGELKTMVLFSPFYDQAHAAQAYGKVALFADNTFNVRGVSSATFRNPVSFTDLHSITASFSTDIALNKVYANADRATAGSAAHSFAGEKNSIYAGANYNQSGVWDYSFTGIIHAMRVYNRILTDDEVLHNYQYDVSRYL